MPTPNSKASASTPLVSKDRWAQVDRLTRLFYLESCRANLRRIASFWVDEEARLRGHSPKSEAGAESWLMGPWIVARMLRYLEHGLRSGGRPVVPSLHLRIDGRSICRLFPFGFYEGLIFWGYQGDVWSIGTDLQGKSYRTAREDVRGPALILAPTNISSIIVTDILWKLFAENRPVVCLIPERWGPIVPLFVELLHPLLRDHHLALMVGGAKVGQALLERPELLTVHFTGRSSTMKTITANNRFPERRFSAQLGCVTPCLLVPGPWTQHDIHFQAQHIVSLLTFNGGYHCATPQVLLLSAHWPHKKAFQQALRAELLLHEHRDDLYPDAPKRRKQWRSRYPHCETYGPRTLVCLDPDPRDPMFLEEAFCGMIGWVELDVQGPEAFLDAGVQFCNDHLYGDLSCNIIIDPMTRRDSEVALAQAVSQLHYGTVGVNVFAGLGFLSTVTPWGSYRGGRTEAGAGWAHNTFFFDRPEKSVLEGSFVPKIVPVWYKPFPELAKVGQALFELDLEPHEATLFRLAKAYGSTLIKRSRTA